jgi:hypothetical protein
MVQEITRRSTVRPTGLSSRQSSIDRVGEPTRAGEPPQSTAGTPWLVPGHHSTGHAALLRRCGLDRTYCPSASDEPFRSPRGTQRLGAAVLPPGGSRFRNLADRPDPLARADRQDLAVHRSRLRRPVRSGDLAPGSTCPRTGNRRPPRERARARPRARPRMVRHYGRLPRHPGNDRSTRRPALTPHVLPTNSTTWGHDPQESQAV